ncbi:MAG: hypothetical protein D8M57_06210 [Candidatus Scalindua sp. AMX11]|nr:MAG: hypothetical protein DWQ00_14185 [Candidatus Scalindua sp.]NOG85442.1 hypothetical protein [Planctomycetota bacterium]RZV84033.1 MAG: hypothetical protein EX341_08870 [Candidatus Scalindua sp. SCAELEC01]TDE65682.1 MAG: hypothetical protein D8M57_06210 [Candidatus Scalindua sp. AMX11]GJQ58832.1 MAG: hypothetical protein SCALA701_16330 [Candidatus Scalindua sp.]
MKSTKDCNGSDRKSLHNFLDKIDFRVARTKEELEGAAALVHKEYTKKGYIKNSNSKLRLGMHNAHPQTTTFVATAGKDVIATTTVILDSSVGLPMDEIYHQELNQLRAGDKKICEISMLACDTELFNNGVSMMLNSKKLFLVFSLFKHILDYTKEFLKLDYICITINPKHKITYDFLLFKDMGELKMYDEVNNAPAIAKYINLNTVEKEFKKHDRRERYSMFIQRKTDPGTFSNKYQLTYQDLKYFFVEKTDIFKDAAPSQIAYLQECYPKYDFNEMIYNKPIHAPSFESTSYWEEREEKPSTLKPCLSFNI